MYGWTDGVQAILVKNCFNKKKICLRLRWYPAKFCLVPI